MKVNVTYKVPYAGFGIALSLLIVCGSAWAGFVIHSPQEITIELISYDGLKKVSFFKAPVFADRNHKVDTTYRGLVLLVSEGGQHYPLIVGDDPFVLKINTPDEPPSFVDSSENELLYTLLAGGTPIPDGRQNSFALLMIQAKELLDSTHNIHTIEELSAKKREFHDFVSENYDNLKHSDMIRRLITQYFMMHEYVSYHVEGAPATDIRVKYQQAILNGVDKWVEILQPYIPGHEVLNYIVSLYYNRSMVSLASIIIKRFPDIAYCSADVGSSFSFSDNLYVTNANSSTMKALGEIKGTKIIALVSDDCPVSMVETVNKARKLIAQHSDVKLIIAPIQELSEKHLAMRKMISGGGLFFIDDQKWREEQLLTTIKLPLFLKFEAE